MLQQNAGAESSTRPKRVWERAEGWAQVGTGHFHCGWYPEGKQPVPPASRLRVHFLISLCTLGLLRVCPERLRFEAAKACAVAPVLREGCCASEDGPGPYICADASLARY